MFLDFCYELGQCHWLFFWILKHFYSNQFRHYTIFMPLLLAGKVIWRLMTIVCNQLGITQFNDSIIHVTLKVINLRHLNMSQLDCECLTYFNIMFFVTHSIVKYKIVTNTNTPCLTFIFTLLKKLLLQHIQHLRNKQ